MFQNISELFRLEQSIFCISIYIYLIIYLLFFLAANPGFVGDFENHKYTTKNNWHYVSITYDSVKGTYKWENKAGVSWTLYPTNNGNELKVGTDCPYYKNGHVVAKFDANGVEGPHGEIYSRKCECSSFFPFLL